MKSISQIIMIMLLSLLVFEGREACAATKDLETISNTSDGYYRSYGSLTLASDEIAKDQGSMSMALEAHRHAAKWWSHERTKNVASSISGYTDKVISGEDSHASQKGDDPSPHTVTLIKHFRASEFGFSKFTGWTAIPNSSAGGKNYRQYGATAPPSDSIYGWTNWNDKNGNSWSDNWDFWPDYSPDGKTWGGSGDVKVEILAGGTIARVTRTARIAPEGYNNYPIMYSDSGSSVDQCEWSEVFANGTWTRSVTPRNTAPSQADNTRTTHRQYGLGPAVRFIGKSSSSSSGSYKLDLVASIQDPTATWIVKNSASHIKSIKTKSGYGIPIIAEIQGLSALPTKNGMATDYSDFTIKNVEIKVDNGPFEIIPYLFDNAAVATKSKGPFSKSYKVDSNPVQSYSSVIKDKWARYILPSSIAPHLGKKHIYTKVTATENTYDVKVTAKATASWTEWYQYWNEHHLWHDPVYKTIHHDTKNPDGSTNHDGDTEKLVKAGYWEEAWDWAAPVQHTDEVISGEAVLNVEIKGSMFDDDNQVNR